MIRPDTKLTRRMTRKENDEVFILVAILAVLDAESFVRISSFSLDSR